MHSIYITAQIRETAEAWAEQIARTYTLTNTSNYTGLNEPDRYKIGFVGELCFEQFLKSRFVPHEYKPNLDGKSDRGDFYLPHLDKKLDIKTASNKNADKLLVPQSQYYRHNYPIYVGMRINGDDCQIMGYANRIQFKKIETKVSSMYVDYEDLYLIEDLVDLSKFV